MKLSTAIQTVAEKGGIHSMFGSRAMRPKDPGDRVPGWLYEIVCRWSDPEVHDEETVHMDFAYTLDDARDLLKLDAEMVAGKMNCGLYPQPGGNRYKSRGEGFQVEVAIRPVEAEDARR